MSSTLVLGFGNPDRQDDGVAWHVLCALAERLDLPAPETEVLEFLPAGRVRLRFELQLTPELAEELVAFERLCFIDAHTGDMPQAVCFIPLGEEYQPSPLTHHLTPQGLLAICRTLYGKTPPAMLLSLRGHQFGFERGLSEETAALLPQALDHLINWLNG